MKRPSKMPSACFENLCHHCGLEICFQWNNFGHFCPNAVISKLSMMLVANLSPKVESILLVTNYFCRFKKKMRKSKILLRAEWKKVFYVNGFFCSHSKSSASFQFRMSRHWTKLDLSNKIAKLRNVFWTRHKRMIVAPNDFRLIELGSNLCHPLKLS